MPGNSESVIYLDTIRRKCKICFSSLLEGLKIMNISKVTVNHPPREWSRIVSKTKKF
jgi:hypothetical protein